MKRKPDPLPPPWADKLLEWRCPESLLEEVQGDLHELFEERVAEVGLKRARQQYVLDVLGFLRPFAFKKEVNENIQTSHTAMLSNYLKIALRNLLRNKGFSFINISGLAVGMASAILISLWIQNEVSYDQFHDQKDRLYQTWIRSVVDGRRECWNTMPSVLGKTLKTDYPEIKEAIRVRFAGFLLTIGDKNLTSRGNFTDPGFLTMFSFPLVQGNARTALNGVYSIVITEKLAEKLFGEADPMGKVLRIDHKHNVTVTGVLKDLPTNTRFDFEYLLPWEYVRMLGWDDDDWDNNSISTYVELKPRVSLAAAESKIRNVIKAHTQGKVDNEIFLHPISKWRLYSRFENGINVGGRIEIVRLFGIVAGFILLIACINFMNLSTARSEKRAKEVGIRKVVGANKQSLIGQFLGESLLIASIAVVLALLLVQGCLPAFNLLIEKQLSVPYNQLTFWLAGILFVLFTGVVAGSYPAFYLSAFQPVKVLKGTFKAAHALVTPRKLLVVVQFTFAIALIICTIVVEQQINYAQSRDTGYAKNNLIYHYLTGDMGKNYPLIKSELISSGAAISVSKTSAPITEAWSNGSYEWKGKDPNLKLFIDNYCTDGDLVKTTGLKLVMGRDINVKDFPTDSTACLLNETAAKVMGFSDPLGQIVKQGNTEWHVVGVIKDFLLHSPYDPTEPMVIQGPKGWFNVMHIKMNNAAATSQNLSKIEQVLKKYNPDYPFEYHFVDEEYARKFNEEQKIATFAGVFSALTIFISCLGLFGLATYLAHNRIKEIGIRKVLGASVFNITTLLSKDFLKLVVISAFIAFPLAWFVMNKWLQDYTYRIEINWWIFIFSGIAAIIIALATVSFQAIKAAITNPVKSLRSE